MYPPPLITHKDRYENIYIYYKHMPTAMFFPEHLRVCLVCACHDSLHTSSLTHFFTHTLLHTRKHGVLYVCVCVCVRRDSQQDTFAMLVLISNDCYKSGAFYYAGLPSRVVSIYINASCSMFKWIHVYQYKSYTLSLAWLLFLPRVSGVVVWWLCVAHLYRILVC